MIITEYLNDNTLIKHYSDKGRLMRQEETGNLYGEAIDVVPCLYTYTETDMPAEEDTEISDTEALNIITGNET